MIRLSGLPLLLCSAACLLAACAHPEADGRRWVRGVRIEGTRALSAGELREGLVTQATSWLPFTETKWFSDTSFELDLRRIVALYAERGFYGARIVRHAVERQAKNAVSVRIVVDEGTPTRVLRVLVDGLPELPRDDRTRLVRVLPLREGRILDYRDYEKAKERLKLELRDRGYAYARVTGEVLVDRSRAEAVVRLVAQPGPEVRFGRARLVGHGEIPAALVLRKLLWSPGQRFHPELLVRSTTRLHELEVFSSVRLELPARPTPVADVLITVAPGKLRRLRLGGGLGIERRRQEVRLQAEWTLRNFLGGLRTLRLRAKPAFVVTPAVWDVQRTGPAVETDVTLTQPDLLGSGITVHGLVGYDLGVHEGYRYHGPRTRIGAERPFWRDLLRIGLSWNLQYFDFFDIDSAVFNPAVTPLGLGFKDPYRLAWLEQVAELDLRDNPLDPRTGGWFGVRLEEGFGGVGGDFAYFKLTPEARGYLPLGQRFALAARLLWGWLKPASAQDSPITRRYALGGPTSHRGFTYGRLAPQVRDPVSERLLPIGGDAAFLGSFELKVRVVRLVGYWLGVVAFVDGGDVTPELAQLDLRRLHWAVGGSLAYETPIGAVRLGLGVRLNRLEEAAAGELPNPDPGERLAFHLMIGASF